MAINILTHKSFQLFILLDFCQMLRWRQVMIRCTFQVLGNQRDNLWIKFLTFLAITTNYHSRVQWIARPGKRDLKLANKTTANKTKRSTVWTLTTQSWNEYSGTLNSNFQPTCVACSFQDNMLLPWNLGWQTVECSDLKKESREKKREGLMRERYKLIDIWQSIPINELLVVTK